MAAVAYRVRRRLASTLPSAVATGLLIAVATGVVLTLFAGARRTDTAPERLTTSLGGDLDAGLSQGAGLPRVAEVRSLPAVRSVASFTFVAISIGGGGDELNSFAGDGLGPGGRLVTGRAPAPDRPHEFVANKSFVAAWNAHLGDPFPVRSLDQDQVERFAFGEDPLGASFTAQLVGVSDSPNDLDDPTPTVYFPPALLAENVGLVQTIMAVDLASGATLDDLRQQLDTLPGGAEMGLDAARTVSDSVRTSVDGQAKGLWVVAGVAALAVVVALGTVLTRQSVLDRSTVFALEALGTTRRQLTSEVVGRAIVPVGGGLLLGVGAAAAASGIFPTSFARRLEPDPGIRPDFVVLPIVAVALGLGLLGWVAVAAALSRRAVPVAPQSRTIARIASVLPGRAAGTGLRFGLARHQQDAASAAATTAGISVAVIGLLGALVFGSSLDRLTADGFRYGNTYDLLVGNGWFQPAVDLGPTLADDPDVAGLLLLGAGSSRSGSATVELIGFTAVRGGLEPASLTGRLPRAADEIALGRSTSVELGRSVGDDLTLDGPEGPRTYRVVGTAVIPSLGINAGLGKGALLTMESMQQFDPTTLANAAAVVLTPATRADRDGAVARLRARTQMDAGIGTTPSPIRTAERLSVVPRALVVLLTVLGIAVLAHAVLSSIRRRRRDLAVLGALGAEPRLRRAIVRWQALAIASVPLLVGVPLGVIGGRLVFREFAARLGAVPDPLVDVLVVLLAIGATLVIAVLAAEVADRRRVRLAGRLLSPE